MAIPPASSVSSEQTIPRPKDVGILAMEVYFPHRVMFPSVLHHGYHISSYVISVHI